MSNPLKTLDRWADEWVEKPTSEAKQNARAIFLFALVIITAIAVGITYLLLWINYPYLTLGLHSIPLILFILWLIKD